MAARGTAPLVVRLAARVALAAAVLTFPAAISARDHAAPEPEHGFLQPQAGAAATAAAATLPPGFADTAAFAGLIQPTNLRFASDGRVFVTEKSGLLKVFDSLSDTTPTVVVDLRGEVDDYWDRGLLGIALDPSFPSSPFVYLLYTYDAPPGQTAPVWNDGCPSPPGPTTDGCVVSGKLIKIQLAGDTITGSPQTLISGAWCQQYPSHSVGDLNFGPDGMLYVTGGDGASFNFADYGQGGGGTGSPTTANPCGDPPAGVGVAETPPAAEGGALRSQSVRRPGTGPVLLNGALLRVDPATGAAAAGNPLGSSSDANARRILAYGMRNPFRFTFRPGTSELWIGDVGWNDWEEIERRVTPTGGVQNFGWPCYEGTGPQPGYQSAGLNSCTGLYSAGTAVAPYYTYKHSDAVVAGDNCPTANGSVISALAFYPGGSYGTAYNGALFFGDHSRNCIWAMQTGANGLPDPTKIQLVVGGAANPVDLESGPGGDMFYVDFDGGTIHRISDSGTVTCPAGSFHGQYFNNITLSGAAVLDRCDQAVNFNWGSGSPGAGLNNDNFSASWSGAFDFQAGSTTFSAGADDGIRLYVDGSLLIDQWKDQSFTTYTATRSLTAGSHQIRVEYYERGGNAAAVVSWQGSATNRPPVAVIDAPSSSLTYAVGDPIAFSGHATDPDQGTLAASALSWQLIVHHCTTPSTCHIHDIQTFPSVAAGSFNAPDHDYPSYVELQLTAVDAGGLTSTTSVLLQPQTVDLTFASVPSGLSLTVGSSSGVTPFTRTVIVKSSNSVSAPGPQTLGGSSYRFSSWSDGGAATHNVTAPATAATYTASYSKQATVPPTNTALPAISGTLKVGKALKASAGSWSGGTPMTFSYDWQRCDANGNACVATGAAGSSYTVSSADIGHRLRVRVTAANSGGSAAATSAATGDVRH